jgi:hypothetical protein
MAKQIKLNIEALSFITILEFTIDGFNVFFSKEKCNDKIFNN